VVAFNADLLAAKEAAPGGPAGARRNTLIGSILDALQVRLVTFVWLVLRGW
jgi:hypothetical protein